MAAVAARHRRAEAVEVAEQRHHRRWAAENSDRREAVRDHPARVVRPAVPHRDHRAVVRPVHPAHRVPSPVDQSLADLCPEPPYQDRPYQDRPYQVDQSPELQTQVGSFPEPPLRANSGAADSGLAHRLVETPIEQPPVARAKPSHWPRPTTGSCHRGQSKREHAANHSRLTLPS